MTGNALNLRARKKAVTREALIDAAFVMFRDRGYAETTVDDISAAAGVSRSTFFRYFPSKEAVVFPYQPYRLARFNELLASGLGQESGFETVRRACFAIAAEFVDTRTRALEQYALISRTPELATREVEIDFGWEVGIFEHLIKTGMEVWRARVVAAALFAAVRATVRGWLATGGNDDLMALGRDAFELLARGFDA